MKYKNTSMASPFSLLFYLLISSIFVLVLISSLSGAATSNSNNPVGDDACGSVGRLVKEEERKMIVSAEYGEISATDIDDGTGKRSYHLQFIKLDPNSLFLPVFLHTDMIFYVHTGSGRLSWTDKDEIAHLKVQRGDAYRLRSGTIFYIQSDLEPERRSLRINAIFAPSDDDVEVPTDGAYSSIHDLIRGFDKRILQAAFKVPMEVIEELVTGAKTPGIVHAGSTKKKTFWEKELLSVRSFLGISGYGMSDLENKKKKKAKPRTFNFFNEDPDFENCNGWSKVVSQKDLHALQGSQITVFMVNLTKGSMMGPHWNPIATEISVVLQGRGMVRVVCPSTLTKSECNSSRFRVKEGDVFSVPRFRPMTQISFNNESLVFMGFSTSSKKNHPQFLAGKASVLQVLDKHILEASFNVANTTIDQILAARDESVMLDCTSCAEEEEMLLEKEIEREREEGKARKGEEEEREREEEEKRRRQEEEERQEEEKRRQKEEKRRQKEEERQREEEEHRRQQEEEERRREERRHKEEEEEERRQEEEEEEQRRQEEEEEEERRKRRHEEETREEEPETEEEVRKEEEERAERERQWDGEGSRRGERDSAEKLAREGNVRRKQVRQRERLDRDGNGSKGGEGRRFLKSKS